MSGHTPTRWIPFSVISTLGILFVCVFITLKASSQYIVSAALMTEHEWESRMAPKAGDIMKTNINMRSWTRKRSFCKLQSITQMWGTVIVWEINDQYFLRLCHAFKNSSEPGRLHLSTGCSAPLEIFLSIKIEVQKESKVFFHRSFDLLFLKFTHILVPVY